MRGLLSNKRQYPVFSTPGVCLKFTAIFRRKDNSDSELGKIW